MMGASTRLNNLRRAMNYAAPGDYSHLLLSKLLNQLLQRPQVQQQRRLKERKVKNLKNSLKKRFNQNRWNS